MDRDLIPKWRDPGQWWGAMHPNDPRRYRAPVPRVSFASKVLLIAVVTAAALAAWFV